MNIILYLLSIIQYLYQQNCWLINFICRYIPLKQWAFDDSHSPNYQKFRVDQLPKIQIIHHEWDWCLLIPYFDHRYNVKIKPVSRRKECDIPQDCSCPSCGAPQPYLYRNNGKAGQLKCKVCNTNFSPGENRFAKQFTLRCPHCGKALVAKKSGSTSFSINVSTPSALTISTTCRKWIRLTEMRTTGKINISFTISTANSR